MSLLCQSPLMASHHIQCETQECPYRGLWDSSWPALKFGFDFISFCFFRIHSAPGMLAQVHAQLRWACSCLRAAHVPTT